MLYSHLCQHTIDLNNLGEQLPRHLQLLYEVMTHHSWVKNIISLGIHPTVQSPAKETRDQWAHPAEFFLTCIATSVGLGNIWRFPTVAFENGGGAFLILYFLILIFIGRVSKKIRAYYEQICILNLEYECRENILLTSIYLHSCDEKGELSSFNLISVSKVFLIDHNQFVLFVWTTFFYNLLHISM